MGKIIVIILLVIFLIYMVVWSLKYRSYSELQKRMKRIHELKGKRDGNIENTEPETADTNLAEDEKLVAAMTETSNDSLKTENVSIEKKRKSDKKKKETEEVIDERDYWINLHELNLCVNDREKERCYHYFETTEEAVHALLLDIYDNGIVRIDELSKIAYGQDHFENVDLSFLEDLDNEEPSSSDSSLIDETIIQVDGLFGTSNDILGASRNLKSDDLVITDIQGSLSDGIENVIKAAEKEKELAAKKAEPITKKESQSVEKAREDRKKTSNQEIRNKLFLKWDDYINEYYEMIEIKASEETKHKIKKALRNYGYNDVDVLLKSPE